VLGVDVDLARLTRGEGLDQEELVRVVDAAGSLEEEVALLATVAWGNSSASASHSSRYVENFLFGLE